MKRSSKTILTVLVLVLTLLLSACGSTPKASNVTENAVNTTVQSQTKTSITTAPSSEVKSNFPLTVTDQAGKQVTIPSEPQHIVSVTEGTDEILSALVPKSKIAMVTTYASDINFSNVTDFVKGIPQIKEANAELIISAKPDLVLLASYTKQGLVDQIKQANIPVYEFTQFNSINDIKKNIVNVGQLVGNDAKAKKVVDTIDSKLKTIENAVKNEKKVSVLEYSSYGYGAGTETTVNDVIVHAGGLNALHEMKGWQKVSDEEIVKLNPTVILVASNDKGFMDKVLHNPALQTVSAVKNKRVYAINGAHMSAVSQYVVDGVMDIAHVLYPDVKLP